MSNVLLITPTLGESPFLGEACESVRPLRDIVRHVVVGPEAQRDSIRKQTGGVEFVPEGESRGLYGAVATGIRARRNEVWMSWLNDDDLLDPRGFRSLLKQLDQTRGDLGYGRVELVNAMRRPRGELPVCRRPEDLLPLFAHGVVPLAQPGTLFRLSRVLEIGSIDETYRFGGDMDLVVRLLQNGARALFIDKTVASFRLREGQLSKNENEVEIEKNRIARNLQKPPALLTAAAFGRFRLANLPVYIRRIRIFGFKRMKEVYRER